MKTKLWIAAAVTALGFLAVPASAIIAPGPPGRPTPPPGWAYNWVPPVYRTVSDRVWVPGRTELVSDWMMINGRWEQVWREITTPGHYESTTRRIIVSEGYWQLVRVEPPRPTPYPRPPVVVVPGPILRNPGTVGVNGYGSGPTEDLSKFSPLREWPK